VLGYFIAFAGGVFLGWAIARVADQIKRHP
jgi:hypothetical protein